jgi:hypothetical protein
MERETPAEGGSNLADLPRLSRFDGTRRRSGQEIL